MMDYTTLLIFSGIIAAATYVQTVTGFALGMIVMGAVTMLNLVPIAFTSVVISLVTLVNGLTAIKGERQALDRRRVGAVMIGIVPGLALGLYLLTFLSSTHQTLLHFALGLAIFVGGMLIMLRPEPLEQPSSQPVFMGAGLASGFLAGLFSLAGPPLVYLFYRQPFELKTIRICLLGIFLACSSVRTIMVGFQGQLTADVLIFSACCIPMVMLFTWGGKRFPPPLSSTNMRRLAFALLIGIGASLMLRAAF
ncbi:sulfite exporter TauE/SafE family protein [Neptunomonas marina]|nr:sulfite exporter TauE/SafE family protein [Neptunomonas marina]